MTTRIGKLLKEELSSEMAKILKSKIDRYATAGYKLSKSDKQLGYKLSAAAETAEEIYHADPADAEERIKAIFLHVPLPTNEAGGPIMVVSHGTNFEAVILDPTHLKMKMEGTDKWATALHFAQVPKDVLKQLKDQGHVTDDNHHFVDPEGALESSGDKVIKAHHKLQTEIVDYVVELADYAGAPVELMNVNYDGDLMYLTFSPDDFINLSSDYDADALVNDVKKFIKNKYHVMIDMEDDGFVLQLSGLKG